MAHAPPTTERYAEPLSYRPGELVRRHDEPIQVGSMLWVLTDPHKGHEFAYNRWYERDHYYAGCMVGKNNFAGSRWVATRAHRDQRLPAETGLDFAKDAGAYACVYYMLEDSHEDWLSWATPQANWLYDVNRGFPARTHYNTSTWRHEWRSYRDADPVLLELALDHRYPGMVAQFVQPGDGGVDAVDAFMADYLPGWFENSPVASMAQWSYIPLRDDKAEFVPVDERDAHRVLQLFFVEDDPANHWEAFEALVSDLGASGAGHSDWTAGFVATRMGTDDYIDQLW
jgi:hypothetical protein